MIGPDWFATNPLVHAIGLGLLHGLWQGTVVAGLAAIALRTIHPMAAGRRHAVLLGGLILQLALLALTVAAVYRREIPQSLLAADPATWPAAVRTPGDTPAGDLVRPLSDVLAVIRPILPWLLAAWAAGVALFAARLVAGVLSAARMRESAARVSPDLERRARELASGLALRRPFRILTVDGIETPVAIGWRRPAVLLPRLLPVRETARGLDSLVLHELAHLKHRDDGVALAQSALTCLFFHHPGTWWLAGRLTREREHRCDDLVAESGDPAAYVRALMGLEERRVCHAGSALHADAGSLLERVRRIVEPRGRVSRRRVVAGLLSAVAIAIPATWGQLLIVPAVPATPPGWSTIRAVDDAGKFSVVMERGRVRAVAIDGTALPAARFAHVGDSLHILGAEGVPVFSARVRPQGGLEWLSRGPSWRLDGT